MASVRTPNYKWGQRGDWIVLTFDIPDASESNTNIFFETEGRMNLCVQIDERAAYGLDLQLFAPIAETESSWQKVSNKIVVRIKMAKSEKWPSLQKPELPKPRTEKPDFDMMEISDDESDDNEDIRNVLKGRKPYDPPMELPKEPALDEILFEKVTSFVGYKPDIGDFFVFCMIWVSVAVCPFTKVEESFNLQAIHDFEYLRTNFDSYDHHEFPGAVPRSFFGALAVSLPLSPLAAVLQSYGGSKIVMLILSRMFLGMLSLSALVYFRIQITKRFGTEVGSIFMIIFATQFHMVFYMTRTLPNTFAQILVNLAYAFWFQEKFERSLMTLAFCSVVLRSEVALLAFPIMAHGIYKKRTTILNFFIYGTAATILGLGITVGMDSFMWKRLTWPEGESFYFNIVEGKNVDWGVMPFYWYFLNALPRILMFSAFFIPIGVKYDARMGFILAPAAFYLAVYSFVPHKELRFIFYVIPLLNLASAAGMTWLYRNMAKRRKEVFVAFGALVLCGFLSFAFLIASSFNYPGGRALQTLHSIETPKIKSADEHLLMPYVHIDTAAAMTGVSKFLELGHPWSYSKDETTQEYTKFTHLVTERESVDGFQLIRTVEGFDSSKIWALEYPLVPKIYIHRREDLAYLDHGEPEKHNHEGEHHEAHKKDLDDEF